MCHGCFSFRAVQQPNLADDCGWCRRGAASRHSECVASAGLHCNAVAPPKRYYSLIHPRGSYGVQIRARHKIADGFRPWRIMRDHPLASTAVVKDYPIDDKAVGIVRLAMAATLNTTKKPCTPTLPLGRHSPPSVIRAALRERARHLQSYYGEKCLYLISDDPYFGAPFMMTRRCTARVRPILIKKVSTPTLGFFVFFCAVASADGESPSQSYEFWHR